MKINFRVLLISFILFFLGFYFIFGDKDKLANNILNVLGFLIILSGINKVAISYVKNNNKLNDKVVFEELLNIVIGVVLILASIEILTIILGIVFLIIPCYRLICAKNKKEQLNSDLYKFFIGMLMILMAPLLIIKVLFILSGILFVILGVFGITTTFLNINNTLFKIHNSINIPKTNRKHENIIDAEYHEKDAE